MAKVCHPAGRAGVRPQPQPLDGRDQAALQPEPPEGPDPRRRRPARVYVCTRCLKAGKVTKARPSRRGARRAPCRPTDTATVADVSDPSLVRFRVVGPGRARAPRVAPPGDQRPQRVPGRRRRHRRQHGADAARRARRARPPGAESGDRTIDEIGRDEIVQIVARAALLGARGNSGVILSQLIRGAAEELVSPPRRAGRPDPDRRRAGARRPARLRARCASRPRARC